MRAHLLLMCAFSGTFAALAQTPPVNARVFPSLVTQTEPVAVVSPVNPSLMFVSSRTINSSNGFQSEGVYVSTDAGAHWFGSDTCRGQLITNHGGDPGIAITPGGRLYLTHIGSVFPGVYSHYSNDLGATWTNAYSIFVDANRPPEDKGTAAMDATPSSPYYGRFYKVWASVSSFIAVSYTSETDSAWSSPVFVVSNFPPPRYSGGTVVAGRDGTAYLSWAIVSQTSPSTETNAGFAKSTNGGAFWNVTASAFAMNGVNGTLPSKGNIRINGLPQIAVDNSTGQRSGWLYILSNEKGISPAGSDPDILLHRSTDGGATWSAGIRVNQDPVNNGKTQYLPAMEVDERGGVNVMFYDDRNTSSDSAEVFLARSTDGGTTWTERVISDHRFKPKAIAGGVSNYQGDFTSVLSVGRRLFPFWMDDFAGLYQIWSCSIELWTDAVDERPNGTPVEFLLEQNYPNPFNPATTINYQIPGTSHVTMKVFDVLGREVAFLVDEIKAPGAYAVRFDAGKLASGLYFYRLQTGSRTATRKLLVVR